MRTENVRREALDILLKVENQAAYSNCLLQHSAKEGRFSDAEYGLLQQLVKGSLQWQSRLDATFGEFVKGGIKKLDKAVVQILRMGTYQILFMQSQGEKVVNECVEVTKKHCGRGASGVVNAVLRRVLEKARSGEAQVEIGTTAEEISISLSHPEWIIARWIKELGVEETIALCRANNEAPSLTIRVNSLRTSPDVLIADLEREGAVVRRGTFDQDSLTLLSLPPKKRLHDLSSFQDGHFQVQDESSSLVVRLTKPEPGARVLDMCSAPGGKSAGMAIMMNDTGSITAMDIHERKLDLVKDTCRRLGITIVETRVSDAREFSGEEFDVVLLDAPCSGLGVLGRKSDVRWKKKEGDIGELQSLQKELIITAARYVKGGGVLVYSTCTVTVEENEEVVSHLLNSVPGFTIDVASTYLPAALVTKEGYMRTWPHRQGIGGAFAARLRRS